VGRARGGLALASVVASTIFAGTTGAASAEAAGLGKLEIAMLRKDGYELNFSSAVAAASSILGPIIPPSIPMVIYSFSAGNVSLGALLIAGILPGIMIGLLEMVVISVIARRRGFPRRETPMTFREVAESVKKAFFPLLLPIIIIGGIYSGIFTPTEAAAVGVVYAIIIGLFGVRRIKIRDLPGILTRTAYLTSVVMWIVASCSFFTWILTVTGLSAFIYSLFKPFMNNTVQFLIVVNILLLIVGCLMDALPAILIFTPILAPLAVKMGIDPLHFGIVMIVNLVIGLVTPPVGVVLFVTCAVAGNLRMSELVKAMGPFFVVMLISLVLLTFIPSISTLLPRIAGLM